MSKNKIEMKKENSHSQNANKNSSDLNNNHNVEQSLYDKYLEQMNLIQEKTGIPGTYVTGGLLAALVFVYIGFLERFITNLVGTVYPAFWTMKSIESKGDDDKQWLTYWVVFACFTLIDLFSGFILKFIPFYFFIKIVFLIWLFMPNSQGCNIIYHLLVVRVFKSFEQDIDQASEKLGEYTKDLITKGSNFVDSKKEGVVNMVFNSAADKLKEGVKELANSYENDNHNSHSESKNSQVVNKENLNSKTSNNNTNTNNNTQTSISNKNNSNPFSSSSSSTEKNKIVNKKKI